MKLEVDGPAPAAAAESRGVSKESGVPSAVRAQNEKLVPVPSLNRSDT